MLLESFTVNIGELNDFNGPLDLLIHLIREKEIEIINVNLTKITDEYINYINEIKKQSIEIASEYLAMAAYLIELKSNSLIPKAPVEVEDNYEDIKRQEFIDRLVEYHKIKEVSEFFKERQKSSSKLISKPKTLLKIRRIDDDELPLAPNTLDIDKFAKVFLKVIEKQKRNNPAEKNVKIIEISPEEVVKSIKSFMDNHGYEWINLEELIESDKFSISMLVVVFVSILELAKEQYLRIEQKEEQILVRRIMEVS